MNKNDCTLISHLSDVQVRFLLNNIIYFFKNCDSGRGIWKRIDENREVLEFLKNNNVLSGFSPIECWLSKQDEFLVSLCNVMNLKTAISPRFPRPWKGKYRPHYLEYDENKRLRFVPDNSFTDDKLIIVSHGS